MKVTPLKKFGKYLPGDAFEMSDKVARIYIKKGKLREYQTASVVPEPVKVDEPAVEISERTGLPKRVYRRRDMEAE